MYLCALDNFNISAMIKMLKVFVLLVVAVLANVQASAQKSVASKNSKEAVVNVTIQNNTFSHVDMINAYGKSKTTYASSDIQNDRFTIKLTDFEGDIYRFDFGNENYLLFVVKPGETINMTVNAENLQEIVNVTGSTSMDFVKDASSYTLRKKVVLDSLNQALQSDQNQKYWSSQAQKINQFAQANAEADRYVLATFQSVDSMKALITRYASSGKIKGSNLDVFANAAVKALKEFDRNYRPFANFLDMDFDFSDKGSSQYQDYFTLRSQYIMEKDSRYNRAQRYLGKHVDDVRQLIEMRDSLSYSNLWDKGKNKAIWAQHVVDKFAPVVDEICNEHDAWSRQLEINKDIPRNLVGMAQNIVKEIVSNYQTQYNENDSYLNNKMTYLIREHKDDVAVLMFLDLFPREQHAALHEEVITALHNVIANHPIVKERWDYMHSSGYKTSVGSMAPELEFPNPDGKMLKLSDLRGKVVIVDFWASWCGPCRRENPNVRRIYAQYHDKGLEIFSVSLDRDGAAWKKAIQDDQLVWPNHVSDLKQWQSQAAAIYGVRSIPATFILDREGRIVAKDLRGAELERAVKQLLEQ